MAILEIEIPDPQIERVRSALCAHWRYDPEIDGPSKLAFIKAKTAAYLKALVFQQERQDFDPEDPGIT
jgi:hypothetical protein